MRIVQPVAYRIIFSFPPENIIIYIAKVAAKVVQEQQHMATDLENLPKVCVCTDGDLHRCTMLH